MSIRVLPHPKCLRGLHFVMQTSWDFDPLTLADALEAASAPCVRADERYGALLVPRIVVMFQVEYRVAERPREVSLIHRTLADAETRARSEQRLMAVLAATEPP